MVRNIKHTICLLMALAGLWPLANGQVKNTGIPFIRNFPKEAYNAGTQNWAIGSDKRGMVYFANNQGLLEFDGNLWRKYPLPNGTVTRSLSIDSNQNIYVGGYNEFGFLTPDQRGQLTYHSLNDLRQNAPEAGDFWRIYTTKYGVIFQSHNQVILWNGSKLKTLLSSYSIHLSFYVNDVYYVQNKNEGILKFDGQKFVLLHGSEQFINVEIWSILPGTGNNLIVGTFNNGLFEYNGSEFRQLQTEASLFLKQNQIFCSAVVGNSALAYGTIQNGVLITDRAGNILQHIDRHKGLQNNTVLSLMADSDDNLWVGLDNGIDYIETGSPLSNFVLKKEIGTGYASVKWNNYVYLGTNQGLFRKKWENGYSFPFNEKIEKVEGVNGQVWSLAIIGNNLYCAHDKGPFIINDLTASRIANVEGAWLFLALPWAPATYVLGTYSGLKLFRLENRHLVYQYHLRGFYESSRVIELDSSDSSLWICHGNKGIYHVKFNPGADSVLWVQSYNQHNGLPPGNSFNLFKLDGQIYASTPAGVFRFSNNRFEKSELPALMPQGNAISALFKGAANLYWYVTPGSAGVMLKHIDGRYSIENTPLQKVSGNFVQSFENIVQVDPENVIMAAEDGFVHYNPQLKTNFQRVPQCYIREVWLPSDSLLYGGNLIQNPANIVELNPIAYKYNQLKIIFVSNSFSDDGKTKYRYILENFDKKWSDWGTQTTKEYTNLPEGEYIFKVIAMNIYGLQSETTSCRFRILAPWYRSWWAYLAYFVIIAGILAAWFYRINKRHEAEKLQLKTRQKKILEEKDREHSAVVELSQQEIVKLRNNMLELENERARAEIEAKRKELASMATQMIRKNEILEKIKSQLEKLGSGIRPDEKKKINTIIRSIDQDIHIDEDWERFEHNFDQVHGDFIKKLRERYPKLTPSDLKLCAYLKMNISSKEIAPLLNISPRSVEVSRYRLRKKLGLSQTDNLVDFMLGL